MIIISDTISSKILIIGPAFSNHQGGIGAVIESYSKYFEKFNFIASYKPGSLICKISVFMGCIIKLFVKLIIDPNIRIIHIHGASNGSFYRKFICFVIGKYIFRKKIIYHIHGGGFQSFYLKSNRLTKKLIELLLEKSDCVICLSSKWQDFFEHNFIHRRIIIIPNIIDYPIETNKDKRTHTMTLLFLGLICQNKGIFDLLKVLSGNKKKYMGKIRLIIGGNGETEKLKKVINSEKLEEIVEFVGWVSHDIKASWLQKTDIYILPSYIEGLPISILEAMSYGKSIISTNVGGIPEIVIPGKNGILIEPGNLIEIKSAIDYFIEYPERIEKYGKESKSLIENNLPHMVMSELIKLYKEILTTSH